MYKLGITGHTNIEKNFNIELIEDGNIYQKEAQDKTYKLIDRMVKQVCKQQSINLQDKQITLVSGMARGVDELFALYAIKNNLPLIASIPYSVDWHKNREPSRGIKAQAIYYDTILDYIEQRIKNGCEYSKIVEVKKNYNNQSFHFVNFARNQNIIDESEGVISFYNYESTGTKDAITRAKKSNKYLGNVSNFDNLPNIFPTFNIKYDSDVLIEPSDVLIQGCNCFHSMGSGIAFILKKKFPQLYEADLQTIKGDRNKLGTFTYLKNEATPYPKYIVNLYSQYTMYNQNDMFNHEKFEEGMINIINFFIDKRKSNNSNAVIKFSFPPIGLGLANGEAQLIFNILKKLETKFSLENIELNMSIWSKDKILQETFKVLELQSNTLETCFTNKNKKINQKNNIKT